MVLQIDDVIKNITVHNGASRGVSGQELRAIWHALWNCVERLLAQGKSVTVPNFCTVSVVSHNNMSTLTFALHPYFTSSHCISSPSDVKTPATGAATAVPLHASFIEQELQGAVPRHAIVNTLKDTVRHIGLIAGTGKALRLDCNPVMTMSFLNCRCSVSFNGRLARVLPSPARSMASSKAAAGNGAQQDSVARSEDFGVQVGNGGPRPPSGQQQQQQQQQMPQATPPGSAARSDRSASGRSTPRSNASSRRSGSNAGGLPPVAGVNAQSVPMLASMGRNNNATENISAARGNFSQGSASARAFNHEQRMSVCRGVVDTMPGLSQHKKHMLKKNMYRHMRGDVYRNIWEQNQADVSARRAQEAAMDRQLMEHLDAVAAHEKAMLEERERNRRRKAIEDRLLNQRLAPMQKHQQLPRAQDPGEIFYNRSNPMVLQKDTTTLQRQMDDRKHREELEREADRQLAEQAHDEYLRVKEEAAEAKRRKAQRQAELRDETERIIHEKTARRQQELDHDRHMARTGGLFFEEGGNVFAERSRVIMRENVDLMRQRATQSQNDRESALRNQGIEFQNQLVEDAATAVAHRKQEMETKAAMRAAWDRQMQDKQMRLREEKRTRDQWRDKMTIQNSSSDDEDD